MTCLSSMFLSTAAFWTPEFSRRFPTLWPCSCHFLLPQQQGHGVRAQGGGVGYALIAFIPVFLILLMFLTLLWPARSALAARIFPLLWSTALCLIAGSLPGRSLPCEGPVSHTGRLGGKSVVQCTLQSPPQDQKEENLQPKCVTVISFLLVLCPICHSASETPLPPQKSLPLDLCLGCLSKDSPGISLVAQWVGIHLPGPGTRISIHGLGRSHLPWSKCTRAPPLLKAVSREAVTHKKRHHDTSQHTAAKSNPCSRQPERARTQQRRPSPARN